MSFRNAALVLVSLVSLFWVSCQKNTVSKIPFIDLIAFGPDSSIRVNLDTPFIQFHLVDGDADIGVDDNTSAIFLLDSRFDSAYMKIPFPAIDGSIEDPKKGLEGKCTFFPDPLPVPRDDSLHNVTGDTLYYRIFITDRAGHHSDTITTHSLIIKV
jgi:hypothetical protein